MRIYLFYPQMIDYTYKILDLKFHFFNTSSKYFFNVFLGYCWEILLWIWFFFLWLQYTFSLRICWNSFWAFDVLKFHIHVWLSFLIHPTWHCMGPFQLRCYNFFPIWKKFSNNFLEYFPPSFFFLSLFLGLLLCERWLFYFYPPHLLHLLYPVGIPLDLIVWPSNLLFGCYSIHLLELKYFPPQCDDRLCVSLAGYGAQQFGQTLV